MLIPHVRRFQMLDAVGARKEIPASDPTRRASLSGRLERLSVLADRLGLRDDIDSGTVRGQCNFSDARLPRPVDQNETEEHG